MVTLEPDVAGLEQRAAAAEARLSALEAALSGTSLTTLTPLTPDTLSRWPPAVRQAHVKQRSCRYVGTQLHNNAAGGASAADVAPAANSASADVKQGGSHLSRYITELTSIRVALLKASEEQLAMQKQLKEARGSICTGHSLSPPLRAPSP